MSQPEAASRSKALAASVFGDGWRPLVLRWLTLPTAAAGALLIGAVIILVMGANPLTGYHALIDRTRHPMLTTVMSRIIKDERRHFSFYFNQARRMLQDPAARRITSFLVRHFWTPVGSPVRGDADAHRVSAFLFPGDEGRARLAAVDEIIARLPGLEWFDLGTRFCFKPQSKAAPIGSIPAHQAL